MAEGIHQEEIVVELLSITSPEAQRFGVKKAPALVVNERLYQEGKFSRKAIDRLVATASGGQTNNLPQR